MITVLSEERLPKILIVGLATLCLLLWTIQQDFSPWRPFAPVSLPAPLADSTNSPRLVRSAVSTPRLPVSIPTPPRYQVPGNEVRSVASAATAQSQQRLGAQEQEVADRMLMMRRYMESMAGGGAPTALSPKQQLQAQLGNVLNRYQAATDESGERSALRIEISELLGKQYDAHVESYERQVEELESRLADLREQVKKRRDAKSRLVALKLEQLLSQMEGIGWPDDFSSNSQTGQPYPTMQVPTLPGPDRADAGSKNLLEIEDMSEEDRMKAMQKMFGAGSKSSSSGGSSGSGMTGRSGMSGISGMSGMSVRSGGRSGMSGRSGGSSGMSGMPGMSRRSEGNDTTETSDASDTAGTSDTSNISGGGAPATAPASSETAAFDDKKCLQEVMLAVHNYVDAFGEFPFHVRPEQSERLSWLVRILPWLDEADLANRFDPSQAWNSEHNREWLDHQPALLGAGRKTQVRWVESSVRHFRDIADGTSVTIACILGGEAVYWTEQRPISQIEAIDLFKSLPADGELIVAMYDGSIRAIKPEMGVETFAALLTPAGAENIK